MAHHGAQVPSLNVSNATVNHHKSSPNLPEMDTNGLYKSKYEKLGDKINEHCRWSLLVGKKGLLQHLSRRRFGGFGFAAKAACLGFPAQAAIITVAR